MNTTTTLLKFILFLALVSCNEMTVNVSKNILSGNNSGNAVSIPVADNLTLPLAVQATESLVTLSYVDPNSELATSCAVSGVTNLSVSTPCNCDVSGVCTLGVRASGSQSGPASLKYSVTTSTGVSNPSTVSFNVIPATHFTTVWKTDNPGSANNQISLPLSASGDYDFIVEWGDGTESVITSHDDEDVTHVYAAPGTYTVTMTGIFDRINFLSHPDREKILDVTSWGNNHWISMNNAFRGCTNLNITATDAPNLSQTLSMRGMFQGATNLNSNISHWDVSNISDMASLFQDATSFNQNIARWDVSKVWNMSGMFRNATSFNQPLSYHYVGGVLMDGWDTSTVMNMTSMFQGATSFNQDLSPWNVFEVTQNSNFATGATSWTEMKPFFSI